MGIDSQEKEKFLEEIETKYLQISAKKYGEKYLLAAKPDKTLKMNHFISSCNEEDANVYLILQVTSLRPLLIFLSLKENH